MHPAPFNSPEYKKNQAEKTHQNWQKGVYKVFIKRKRRNCSNLYCKNYFIVPPSDKQQYCSQKCWYVVRRNYKFKNSPPCTTCGKLITQKGASKFCSLKCQATNSYDGYIARWKQGLEDGNIGIKTRFISAYIKRYLRSKYNDNCSSCGWNQINPVTGAIPLEVDHIDGNSENNKEENLRLICPNCHSLTPYFRNLNKGNGRAWRIKYLKKLSNSSLEASTLLQ